MSAAIIESTMRHAAPDSGAVTVVLVDDTLDIRLLLRVALEAQGQFSVIGEAGDGAYGVELVRQLQPDVVLLDLAMPMMDGLEALPLLRLYAPRSKVIVLSGFEASAMSERVISEGAAAFIQKGASVRGIVSAVAEVLGIDPDLPNRAMVSAADESEMARVHSALASAAHELRGPATVLLAMSELLISERQTLDAKTFDEMLNAIGRQAHVLDRVTGDLLASTQSQRGALTVEVERVRLLPILSDLVLGVSDQVSVAVTCPADLCVFADPARVQQMIGNLISNAMRYGAPPVAVAVRYEGEQVAITVTDNGPGVPVDFRDHLFKQFSRAPSARTKGLGLGLYLVKSLAELQGGRVEYAAVPTGGSSFCVYLPGAEPAD